MLRKQGTPVTVKDEGTTVAPAAKVINFVGTGITATSSDGETVTVTTTGQGVTVKEEGSNVTTSLASLDFVGTGVTATAVGSAVTVTVDSPSVAVKEEGSTLTSAATSFDFVGGGVTATNVGAAVTVTVPQGVTTVASVGSSPADGAASISGATITLQPADATHPGVVSEGAQTLGSGTKTIDALVVTGQAQAQSVLLDVSAPSAPSAGVTLHTVDRGRPLPAFLGPTGTAREFQPHIGLQSISLFQPLGNTNTYPGSIGFNPQVTGTLGVAAFATTNALTQTRRHKYTSASSAGAKSDWADAGGQFYWRGNAAGQGGFFFVFRAGMSTIPATRRWFIGLSTGVFSNAEPSSKINIIGVGQDTSDTFIQFMENDGSGSATKTASAISSPGTSDLLEVTIYAAPNGSDVTITVAKVGSAAESRTTSSDLPSSTTALGPYLWANNSSTAASIVLEVAMVYGETEY